MVWTPSCLPLKRNVQTVCLDPAATSRPPVCTLPPLTGREHVFGVSIPSDYPRSPPVCSVDLPANLNLRWTVTFRASFVFHSSAKIAGSPSLYRDVLIKLSPPPTPPNSLEIPEWYFLEHILISTNAVSFLYGGSIVYVFSFLPDGVFLPCDHGLDFDISLLCENAIN